MSSNDHVVIVDIKVTEFVDGASVNEMTLREEARCSHAATSDTPRENIVRARGQRMTKPKVHAIGSPVEGSGSQRTLCSHKWAAEVKTTAVPGEVSCGHCRIAMGKPSAADMEKCTGCGQETIYFVAHSDGVWCLDCEIAEKTVDVGPTCRHNIAVGRCWNGCREINGIVLTQTDRIRYLAQALTMSGYGTFRARHDAADVLASFEKLLDEVTEAPARRRRHA